MNIKLILLLLFTSINNIKPTTIDIHSPDSAIILTSQSKVYVEPGHDINVFAQETFLKNQETENIKSCFENNTVYYKTIPTTKILTQPIDLVNKTLYFFGDTHFTKQATIESSGNFDLNGNTIYLDSDFFIPDNTTLTITSSGIIDGQNNVLTLKKRGQILLDSDVSVTFKNVTFKNKLNTETTPPIKCQNSNSQIIFDKVNFAFTDDFYFTEGQFFINNEVNYTGTSQFIYNSTNPSYIQPNSKFKFNSQTSFSYDPNSIDNNLIVLQKETSCLHFDGSILKTINNGLKLTNGLLYLDNDTTFISYKEDEAVFNLTYSQNYGHLVNSVNWSPNGNYLAVGGQNPTNNNEIQVYSFNGSALSLIDSKNSGGSVYSVNWNHDGKYLAVGGNFISSGDEIQIYYFNGSSLSLFDSKNSGGSVYSVNWNHDGKYLAVGGQDPEYGHDEIEIYYFNSPSLSLTYSQNYGSYAYSINWSPDGNYLAVGGQDPEYGHDEIEIYYFNGSSLSLIDSQNYGSYAYSINWSPDGNYLAVGGQGPYSGNEIQIYSFNGSSLSLIDSQNYGSYVYSVNWSPDGNYLAVGGNTPSNNNEIQIYSFNGSALSLIDSQNYGSDAYSVNWSPDGNYLAVGGYNPDTGHEEIEIYYFKPVPDGPYNITLGNSTLGPEYDLDIKVLGGARVSVNYCNLIYDNTGTTSKTFDFVNKSSSFVLDTKSIFSINRNNIKGWHQQSILRQKGHDNSWTISNTTYGYNTGEIKPSGHLLENNSNAIASMYNQVDINSENIRYNSNAIILFDEKITNTYEYLANKIEENSNAIIFMPNDLQEKIKNNSNAIIKNREDIDLYEQKITNNSNAIVYLDDDTSLLTTQTTDNANSIRYNSNLIIHTIDSNDALIIQNSNAIISANDISDIYNELDPKITNNSNAIINDYEITDDIQILIDNNFDRIKYNSNAIINNKNNLIEIQYQTDTNSTNITHNSNSIVYLHAKNVDTSNLIQENQDAITLLNQDKTILETSIEENSNSIISMDQKITNSYDYLSLLIKNNSNTILSTSSQQLITNNSNDILNAEQKISNNSNAIIYNNEKSNELYNQTQDNKTPIKHNSNAIITLNVNISDLASYNKNSLIYTHTQIKYNSNAIIHDFEITDLLTTATTQNANNIKDNSNTIITSLNYDTWNTNITDNEKNIRYNSNTIINLLTSQGLQEQIDENKNKIKYNSDYIILLDNKITNSFEYIDTLITQNSNAIIHDYEITDDLQNQINNINQEIEENSNTINYNLDLISTNIENINSNSNAIIYAQQDLSKQIKQNSEAIINTQLLEQIEENSNDIVSLQINLNQEIKENSNAIINNDNNIRNIRINNQNVTNNSNAIINTETIIDQNYINSEKNIKNNSNAIISSISSTYNLENKIKYNSNAIIHNFEITDLLTTATTQNANNIKDNSNTIITSLNYNAWDTHITDNEKNIRYNSNTIINILTTQNLQEQIDENKDKIKYNSNYIILLDNKITNSFEYIDTLITQNSNAIIHDYEITDDLQNQINNINQEIEENSNTIIYNLDLISTNTENINSNSNAIFYAQQDLSKQIKQNSEAIINTQLLEQIEENSNAIVSLQINLNQEIKENSNAIINNDNDINTNNQNATNNSNAIIQNTDTFLVNYLNYKESIKNNSNAIINDYSLSYSLITRIRNNSKGILYIDSKPKYPALQAEILNNAQDIKENSNAIIHNNKQISELYDTIRHNSDAIVNFDNIIGKKSTILTKEPITADISLDQSVFIHPEQIIEITDNAIIDGKGAVVLFGATDNSQFKVQAGKTVTLKNIQLLRINQKTFDLRYKLIGTQLNDGKIKIGQNVIFGLSENITFSQGLIEILNNDQEEAQLFQLKGIEGQKQFKIYPNDEYANALSIADNNLTWLQRQFGTTSGITSRFPDRFTQNGTVPVLVKCNNNTFGIQNINLSGFEHITKSTSGNYTGALALLGEAAVDIGDNTFTDFEKNKNILEKYDMVFVTQNLNNSLRILKDDLKFTGQLQFADFGENVLHIDSLLTERIKPKIGSIDPNRKIPQINFATNFVQLTSAFGMGRLVFDDNRIRINNDENGFVAYENSFLGAHTIEITGDPIWDLYDPDYRGKEFVLEVNELIGLDDINNQPIISEFYSSIKLWNTSKKRIKTAIDLIYEKELAKLINKKRTK